MNSFNDPLLFINGPPVFHLPKKERKFEIEEMVHQVLQDESTSIYEKPSTNSGEYSPGLLEKLYFLSKPFQRKVYRPLVFHLENGVHLQGEVETVNNDQVTFLVASDEHVTYPVNQVEKIFWRGNLMK